MHELALCQSLLNMVCEQVPDADRARIKEITVAVGTLANIDKEALIFAYQALQPEYRLQQAELVWQAVPAVGVCSNCGFTQAIENRLAACCQCEQWPISVTSGDDIQLQTIELSTR